jgi:Protein of unknown function (DUF3800)
VTAQYALYIDDSGTKEYAKDPTEYGRTGNSRYFVFGGVLITTAESGTLSETIKKAKRVVFGTDAVEIKSNWLRIPKERTKRYRDKYSIDDDQIEDFVNHYYMLISKANLRLFAAVIDKVHVQEDYGNPWYAPAIAYEVLMQRIVQSVKRPESVSVIIDDMTGATPKGRQYRSNLVSHHEKLRKNGSQLLRKLDFSSILPGIRFVDSARSHLIQVADVIAYNVYRQFVDYGECWERGDATESGELKLQTYEWFDRIGEKFHHGPDGRVQGFGLVKFPLRNRIPWKW